jgi:hypothetical protein
MMNNMSQGLGSFNNMMPQNNMMQQNPYGQQMGQQMGQQVRSPEMFSEQLMNPNQMMQPNMENQLQPMSEPEGFGVYGQSLSGFADGGAASSGGVPRQAELMGQPHMLAYINPQEEQMLRDAGGAGIPGPDGIPVYGWLSDTWSEIKSGGKAVTETYNSPKNNTPANVAPAVNNNSGSNSGNNTPANVAPAVAATTPTIPTFNTYYDAIDAGYGGKTVNIGGKNVKAVTADGYTGNTPPAAVNNTSVNTTSPVNTGSTPINIGAVSNTGQYAGDGFEWQVTPGTNALTRTFTGAGSRQQADATNQGVGQGVGLTQAEQLAGYRDNTKNTFKEYLANTFTPGDNLAYKNGQLVYEKDHKDYDPSNEFKAVSPEERNSFNLRVGMGNSSVNDNPGESNYANYGEARAARQGSIPGIPSILGGIGAYLGGIRPEDEAVGYGANGEQIFKSGNGYFYVIDRNTGLVRNVQGANDSSNSEESMQRQREMMENRTSGDDNNAFNPQLGMPVEQAVNNPVIDNPYSLTPLKRAVTGIGSNVGSFYDTGNTVVESSTDPFAGAPQGGGALTFEELMRLNQQQNRII